MRKLLEKYICKLKAQGLSDPNDSVLISIDADMFYSRPLSEDIEAIKDVFKLMNINSILFARPAEPYWSIICEILSREKSSYITPMDCETRTFFHDIPIVSGFSPRAIAEALSFRKSAVIRDKGIVSYGTVTPEQAFVSFSSTCFSLYVKYFYDSIIRFEMSAVERRPIDHKYLSAFRKIAELITRANDFATAELKAGPPDNEEEAMMMMVEAGRAMVFNGLVDSYFGNISYILDDRILISQTGSSLDELEGCIDVAPLDNSSSAAITASSELSAHKNIFFLTGDRAILHGHPKFSVIMSMLCDNKKCGRTDCHRACDKKREILGIPIVPGEIGSGRYGLVNTVPPAIKSGKGVIVYGHGVFTAGENDFQSPFKRLIDIEEKCKKTYFSAAEKYLGCLDLI